MIVIIWFFFIYSSSLSYSGCVVAIALIVVCYVTQHSSCTKLFTTHFQFFPSSLSHHAFFSISFFICSHRIHIMLLSVVIHSYVCTYMLSLHKYLRTYMQKAKRKGFMEIWQHNILNSIRWIITFVIGNSRTYFIAQLYYMSISLKYNNSRMNVFPGRSS